MIVIPRSGPAPYPDWWTEGLVVQGRDGAVGTIGLDGEGRWMVVLDGEEGNSRYILRPRPTDWQPAVVGTLSAVQIRHILYDAERALLLAFGCGGVPAWRELPERTQLNPQPPRPCPTNRPDLAGLRELVRNSLQESLKPYVAL